MRVPALVFVRSNPPLMTPDSVKVVPVFTSIIPSADSVIFLAEENVALVFRVPPFRVIVLAASPKFASAEIESVPAVMVVVPPE